MPPISCNNYPFAKGTDVYDGSVLFLIDSRYNDTRLKHLDRTVGVFVHYVRYRGIDR